MVEPVGCSHFYANAQPNAIPFARRPARVAPDGAASTQRPLRGAPHMNSFTLTAISNLTSNPELGTKGDTTYPRFCLIGNDYAGKDADGTAREAATSVYFVASGALGETIARTARKGDQLIVEARIGAANGTDQQDGQQYGSWSV